MTQTATVNASVSAPDIATIALQLAASYGSAGGPGRLAISGAGTYVCDVAFLPSAGASLVLVAVDALDANGSPLAAPVSVKRTVNSVDIVDEVSAGGALLVVDPAPTHATTALKIITTAPAVVHVVLAG